MPIVGRKPRQWSIGPQNVAAPHLWTPKNSLHLPMWEGGGPALRDVSGHGNDAAISGPVWKQTAHGPALSFDGTNDICTFSSIGGLGAFVNNGDFTTVLVARSTGNGTDWAFGDDNSSGAAFSLVLGIDGSEQWFFFVSDGSQADIVTGPVRDSTRPQVVVCRYLASTLAAELFVDGISYGVSNGLGAALNNGTNLHLGRPGDENSSYWAGDILSFHLVPFAASTAAISQVSQRPFDIIAPAPRFFALGGAAVVAATTAAVTGTATAIIDEDDIVTGGKTIILTLTGDTWVASGAAFNAQRQNIIDGLDSAQVEGTGWNAEVRDKEVVGAVVRTSDTVVTITLTAAASYDITAQEVITVTVPATALVTSASAVIAAPTFTVDFAVAAGRIMSSLTHHGGLAGHGGIAGYGGGLAA